MGISNYIPISKNRQNGCNRVVFNKIHRQNVLKNDKMSLFNFFGKDDNKDNTSSNMDWNALTDIKQLDEIAEESNENPILIFKHSTRCSISRFALKQFENEFNLEGSIKPYFLDLLMHRDISNEIADRFGVQHQSPQVIVIKNGSAIYNASHQDIEAGRLDALVSN